MTEARDGGQAAQGHGMQWEVLVELFERTTDMVQCIDSDGHLVMVNQRWREVLGYAEDELCHHNVFDIIAPDQRPHCSSALASMGTGQAATRIQTRFLTRAGHAIDVEGSLRMVQREDGSRVCMGIFHDCSGLSGALRAVEEERDLRKKETASLREAVAFFQDLLSRLERTQDFSEQIPNPDVGCCWRDLDCDRTDCPCWGSESVRCWQMAGTHCGGEIQGKFAEKIGRCEACQAFTKAASTPLQALSESFNNMIHIIRNKNADLMEAMERALSADRAKSAFLANMSHEIRTPLNGILGMADILARSDLSARQREYVEVIRRSGDTLLTVLNDILDFSKIEAGRLELEEADFDLAETVEIPIGLMAVRAEEKGLGLFCRIHADVPAKVRGDPLRLRQVLSNLTGNAIKFSHGGQIGVEVKVESRVDREVVLHFEVRDAGIGIPSDRIQGLFEPFTQVDSTVARQYGGTGLGLAICRRLVELMGGRIWAESTEGEGSRFHFTVAVKMPEEAALTDEPQARLRGKRILIVDDTAFNRVILREILTSWQCEVAEAASGGEAIEGVLEADRQGQAFAVVILDDQMPGIDGFQTAQALRALTPSRDLAILILSSSVGSCRDTRAMRPGAHDDYLPKPLRRALLLEAMVKACGRVTSPAAEPSPAAGTVVQVQPLGARVLLAEDHPVNRLVASRMLEDAGCLVTTADDGQEALQLLEAQGSFDLVLVDLQMPVVDGFEVARRVRADSRWDRIPLVALTAHALKGDREKCLQAGMDDYLTKPVRADDLLRVLRRWIAGRATGCDDPPPADPGSHGARILAAGEALDRLQGNRELLLQVARLFLEQLPFDLEALSRAVDASDHVVAKRAAHRMRGAASNLGAERFATVIGELEKALAPGDVSALPDLMDRLRKERQTLVDAVLAWMNVTRNVESAAQATPPTVPVESR